MAGPNIYSTVVAGSAGIYDFGVDLDLTYDEVSTIPIIRIIVINRGPVELGCALPLQTVQFQISSCLWS